MKLFFERIKKISKVGLLGFAILFNLSIIGCGGGGGNSFSGGSSGTGGRSINGVLVTTNMQPVVGATVVVLATGDDGVTDDTGTFTINTAIPSGTVELGIETNTFSTTAVLENIPSTAIVVDVELELDEENETVTPGRVNVTEDDKNESSQDEREDSKKDQKGKGSGDRKDDKGDDSKDHKDDNNSESDVEDDSRGEDHNEDSDNSDSEDEEDEEDDNHNEGFED